MAFAIVAPAVAAAPLRIMSANLCTDLMLLMLVPRGRIVSVSWLAHPVAEALMPGADRGVPTNHGSAEEVARDRPDLILVGGWSTPIMRRLAGQVGARVVAVEPAESFAGIRRALREVGAAVGEPARAEALIARMDRTLAVIPPATGKRVIAWTGGVAVPGRGTLTDAIIAAAGARNVARWDGYASFGLEQLLAARPDAVVEENGGGAPSLHEEAARTPLLARAFPGRLVTLPTGSAACGLPQSALAARALAERLRRLPARRDPR